MQVIARQTYDAASVRGMIDDMSAPAPLPPELVEIACSPAVVSQVWSGGSLPESRIKP